MSVMHWLTGWVRFRVVTPKGGERFLNSCARFGIILWQVKPGEKGMTACVRAGQYKLLRRPAKRAKVRLHILKRRGLPLKLAHLRGRPGLVAAFALFWIVLFGLGQFFWTVEINGCKRIQEPALRTALAAQGVAPGIWKDNFSAKEIQLKIMKKYPQISWISINNHGSDVDVQLTEKDTAPPVADQKGWYELRASQNGKVTEIHVGAGTAVVKKGDGVVKGQLLVSAAVENKDEKFMQLYHAAGTVMAETTHTFQVSVPNHLTQWKTCSDSVERRSLRIFGIQIPLSVQLPPQGTLKRAGELTTVRLCGKEIPLSVMRETLTPIQRVIHRRNHQEMKQEAMRMLENREKADFSKAEIIKRKDSVKTSPTGITVTRQIKCRENIAEEVKISQ